MHIARGAHVDRYVIEELLGMGGMAEVWAVRHQLLGTRHALKIIRGGKKPQARLLKEGRAQAALDHRYLLPVRDVLDVDGRMGLLMPCIDGPALDALLKQYRPNQLEALALFYAIATGLGVAHQRGFVHRDLKPGNVLLDLSGGRVSPRIGDFGLVKSEADATETRTGVFFGTPAYAAPEQLIDASSVDHRADLFSLGVIFVELLQGHRPFQGTRPHEIRAAHRRLPDMRSVPEGLRPLAAGLLKLDPTQRIHSAEDVLRQLEALEPLDRLEAALVEEGELLRAAWRQRRFDGAESRGASDLLEATWLELTDSSGPPPHNLPTQRDRFVGRAGELSLLTERLAARARLVTLTGAGGSGKTRLSIQLGESVLNDYPGGVWWFDLASARDQGGLLTAVAQTFHVQLGDEPIRQLGDVIAARGLTLLIFDNFEQILDLSANTLGAWLDRCPDVQMLVTSREPLRLRGERVVILEPMPLTDGVALFAARASAVQSAFTLDGMSAEERNDLNELIKMLDGLPLAIELAAARSRMLSPGRLLDRLSQRFDLLRSRAQDVPNRHRTLQDTIRWSWELLKPWEQLTLAQCSVFEGGFTVEAAEAVVWMPDYPDAPWIEDILSELIDKNLLRSDSDGRLQLLISVQTFAAGELTDRVDTETRHGQFFSRFGAIRWLQSLTGRGGASRRQQLLEERANIVVALRRALARQDAEVAGPCARACGELLSTQGPFAIGVALLEQTRQALPPDTPELIWIMLYEARLRHPLGQQKQTDALLDAAYQLLPDHRGPAWASLTIHRAEMDLLKGHVDVGIKRLRAIIAEPHAARHHGQAHNLMGNILIRQGEMDTAEEHYELSLKILRKQGDHRMIAHAMGNFAILRYYQNRLDGAEDYYLRALNMHRRMKNRQEEWKIHNNLGLVYQQLGRHTEAAEQFEAALAIHRRVGNRPAEGAALTNLASLLFAQGHALRAEELTRQAVAIYADVVDQRSEAIAVGNLGEMLFVRGAVDEARTTLERAVALAIDLTFAPLEAAFLAPLGMLLIEAGEREPGNAHLRRSAEHLQTDADRAHVIDLMLNRIAQATPDVASSLRFHLERIVARMESPPDAALQARLDVAFALT